MQKILLIPLFSLLLIGASCAPQVVTYDNTPEVIEPPAETILLGTPINPNELLMQEGTTPTIKPDSKEGPIAIIKTNFGGIKIQLFEEATPVTVRNFIQLAELNFYDGVLFHRVIPDFMIQGGDPNTREFPDDWSKHGTGGPDYRFEDEFNNFKNIRGRLSMANSGQDTNGSQFFIITAEATEQLNGKHTVFGEVIEGMDIVDKISLVETNNQDHPLEDVKIEDILIERE